MKNHIMISLISCVFSATYSADVSTKINQLNSILTEQTPLPNELQNIIKAYLTSECYYEEVELPPEALVHIDGYSLKNATVFQNNNFLSRDGYRRGTNLASKTVEQCTHYVRCNNKFLDIKYLEDDKALVLIAHPTIGTISINIANLPNDHLHLFDLSDDFFVVGNKNEIRIFNFKTNKLIDTINIDVLNLKELIVSPDGNYLAITYEHPEKRGRMTFIKSAVKIWKLTQKKQILIG